MMGQPFTQNDVVEIIDDGHLQGPVFDKRIYVGCRGVVAGCMAINEGGTMVLVSGIDRRAIGFTPNQLKLVRHD